jgi:hypothetical protein
MSGALLESSVAASDKCVRRCSAPQNSRALAVASASLRFRVLRLTAPQSSSKPPLACRNSVRLNAPLPCSAAASLRGGSVWAHNLLQCERLWLHGTWNCTKEEWKTSEQLVAAVYIA